MARRAYWKGYLKLSLVSCPIALFPATSEREKISFHQLNKESGNRIKYKKVDAETGRQRFRRRISWTKPSIMGTRLSCLVEQLGNSAEPTCCAVGRSAAAAQRRRHYQEVRFC
jgi:hypothetical protein